MDTALLGIFPHALGTLYQWYGEWWWPSEGEGEEGGDGDEAIPETLRSPQHREVPGCLRARILVRAEGLDERTYEQSLLTLRAFLAALP